MKENQFHILGCEVKQAKRPSVCVPKCISLFRIGDTAESKTNFPHGTTISCITGAHTHKRLMKTQSITIIICSSKAFKGTCLCKLNSFKRGPGPANGFRLVYNYSFTSLHVELFSSTTRSLKNICNHHMYLKKRIVRSVPLSSERNG